MQNQWSGQFKLYFERHIKESILKSGKWVLLKNEIYTERSGITINPSESYNAVLKRFLEKKEVKIQVLALSLFQLDKHYIKNIYKGYCGMSMEFILTTDLRPKFYKSPENVVWPTCNIPLEKLPYIFQNQDFHKSKEEPYTKYSVAKLLVLEGRVRLIPEDQAFIVTCDTEKYIVTLHPKRNCSCKLKKKNVITLKQLK